MSKPIIIAVDAMGGDNAPQKVIDGIELHHSQNKDIYYRIFGDKDLINKFLKSKNIESKYYEIRGNTRGQLETRTIRNELTVMKWRKRHKEKEK